MAKTFQMKISGGPELAAALRELGDMTSSTTAKNRLAAGMIKASAPMVDSANQLAAKDNVGEDAIVFVASKRLTARQKKEGGKVPKTSVRTYVGEQAGKGNVGLINEFGTVERTQTTTGKSVGAVPMHPAMRPAFESTASQVLNNIVPVVQAELAEAVKRAQKKAAKKAGK